MLIGITRGDKVVAKYDTKTGTVETQDRRILRYITEGVTLLGRNTGSDGEDARADGPVTYTPKHDQFYPALLDRLHLDGYSVDDNGIAELQRYA